MTKPITDRPLKKPGRKPIKCTEEITSEICARITKGETMKAICLDEHLPSDDTIYEWLAVNPTFAGAYARARKASMERFSHEMVEIADDGRNDYVDRVDKAGNIERVVDPEVVQRSKLRVDTRKWLMSKLAAATYGDKLAVDVSGTLEVAALSDAELERRTLASLEALGITPPAGPLLIMPPAPPVNDKPEREPEPEPEANLPHPTEPTTSGNRRTRAQSIIDKSS